MANKPLTTCPECNVPVRVDNLKRHLRKVHSVQRSTLQRNTRDSDEQSAHSSICGRCGNRIQEWMSGVCQVCLRTKDEHKRYGRRNFTRPHGVAQPVRLRERARDSTHSRPVAYARVSVEFVTLSTLVRKLDERLNSLVEFLLIVDTPHLTPRSAYVGVFWDYNIGGPVTGFIGPWENPQGKVDSDQWERIGELLSSVDQGLSVDSADTWDDELVRKIFSRLNQVRRKGWLEYVAELMEYREAK